MHGGLALSLLLADRVFVAAAAARFAWLAFRQWLYLAELLIGVVVPSMLPSCGIVFVAPPAFAVGVQARVQEKAACSVKVGCTELDPNRT